MKFTGKNDVFFFGCFEKHPKVVSGALRDGFRAREVFGSFEKRTPGPGCSKADYANSGLAKVLISVL